MHVLISIEKNKKNKKQNNWNFYSIISSAEPSCKIATEAEEV